jgi:small subunit ribosomal protein S6
MRRYELMLIIRPDVPDDKGQAVIDRTTRQITAAGGQILKVAPWGRRRLAYPIDRHREGSYHIILFQAPGDSLVELEHTLLITEEVIRHLVTRDERPAKPARGDGAEGGDEDVDDDDIPSGLDDTFEDEDVPERIDESESEAAPAAID